MSAISARTAAAVVGSAFLLTLAPACAKNSSAHFTGPPATSPSGTASHSGPNTCQISALPAEAVTTVKLIHHGGPFPYSRDGIVFGNFEHRLPNQARGYYHEYTVPSPGAKTRGARRVITGGKPLTNPAEFYYTGDHYETFCQIGGA
jgi:ribonuclease T1